MNPKEPGAKSPPRRHPTRTAGKIAFETAFLPAMAFIFSVPIRLALAPDLTLAKRVIRMSPGLAGIIWILSIIVTHWKQPSTKITAALILLVFLVPALTQNNAAGHLTCALVPFSIFLTALIPFVRGWSDTSTWDLRVPTIFFLLIHFFTAASMASPLWMHRFVGSE